MIGPAASVCARKDYARVQNPDPPIVGDDDGAPPQGWVDLNPSHLWVAIRSTPVATERGNAGVGVALATASYLVSAEWHPGVTTKTRLLLDDGRELRVNGVENIDQRHATMELTCTELVP